MENIHFLLEHAQFNMIYLDRFRYILTTQILTTQ